jgi:hypothetical protein
MPTKKFYPTIYSASDLAKRFLEIQGMTARDRLKAYRSLWTDVINAFNQDPSPSLEILKVYEDILRGGLASFYFKNKIVVTIAKIHQKKLEILGIKKISVLQKQKGIVAVDSGTICILDSSHPYAKDTLPLDFDVIDTMKKGHILCFGTAGDGLFNVEIRVVDSPEPLLIQKEMKKVIGGSSRPFILSVPEGTIWAYDCLCGIKEQRVELKVQPGLYKVAVFIVELSDEDYIFNIVLSQTNDFSNNDLTEIENLEP